MFEEQCAIEVLQSALSCAEYTKAHLKCPSTTSHNTFTISVEVVGQDPYTASKT